MKRFNQAFIESIFEFLAIKDRKVIKTQEQTNIWYYQVFDPENWADIEVNITSNKIDV